MSLVGRELICSQLDRLLTAARGGTAGCLVLEGDPGMGKTTLLEWAAREASDMLLLRTRGAPWEATLPFAALSDLMAPLDHLVSELSPAHRRAIQAVREGAPTGVEPLTISAATLQLVALASARKPTLLILDDLQWLDEPSQRILAFVIRRLNADSITILAATRAGSLHSSPFRDLPALEITGLDPVAARQLLSEVDGPTIPSSIDWLITATGGNPLALTELARLSSADLLQRLRETGQPIPLGPTLETIYNQRIAVLSPVERQALLMVAVLNSDELPLLEGALQSSGLCLRDLAAAEDAALIAISSTVAFTHPLIRSAAYHSATAGKRYCEC